VREVKEGGLQTTDVDELIRLRERGEVRRTMY